MHTFSKVREDDGGSWTYVVGYWCPPVYGQDGEWEPLRDCANAAEAAAWVSYLNGGAAPEGGRF